MKWQKLDGSVILLPIAEAVKLVIEKEIEQGNSLQICVGCDSQVQGKYISFATVIVFIRKGKGGFMYLSKSTEHIKMQIKERMIYEVTKSVTVAYDIAPVLEQYKIPLEVHADINCEAHFKSNTALKEAMGYIRGMGYEFKAKPYAFASSSCADKVV
jgi:predicted RNase H-related nuclease YkuK (DUF458 family)